MYDRELYDNTEGEDSKELSEDKDSLVMIIKQFV